MRDSGKRLVTALSIGGGLLSMAVPPVVLADIPAFTQGADRRLSDEGSVPLCNAQATPSLASWGNTVVAGWVDDRQCDPLLPDREEFSLSAFAASADGGKTWTPTGFIRPEPEGHVLGDPVLTVDRSGTFYYASRATDGGGHAVIGVARSEDGGRTFSPPVDASGRGGLRREGVDQDRPWLAADATGSPHDGNVYVTWTEFVERDVMIADAVKNPVHGQIERTVFFSRSTDRGRSYGEAVRLSTPVALPGTPPAEYPGVGTQIAVGPDGEVYVLWADYTMQNEPGQYRQWSVAVWFTRSLDGGRTFGDPQMAGPELVARPTGIGHVGMACLPPEGGKLPGHDDVVARDYSLVLDGNIRVANWPSMAVDASGSADPDAVDHNPYRGRIYVAIAHSPTGYTEPTDVGEALADEADVVLLYSDTRGVTWQGVDRETRPRVRLNDDDRETSRADQFHPQIAVDQRGRVLVTWYDRRASVPENWGIRLYAVGSVDGGETFTPNVAVSDVFFPPPEHHNPFLSARNLRLPVPLPDGTGAGPSGGDTGMPPIRGGWGYSCSSLGEYNGITPLGGGRFLVAWGDNRGLNAGAGDAVNKGLSDLNVYLDTITVGSPSEPGPADPP